MDANQQTNRIQNERNQMITEWTPQLLRQVMRFGFQNGVPADKLNAFQQAVYNEFSLMPLNSDTETDIQVYKSALSKLHPFTGGEEASEEMFRFPEDRETHKAILALDAPERIALTLHYLQGKRLQEISRIIGCSELQAQESMQAGLLHLQESLGVRETAAAETRLEFAKKSYTRIEFSVAENKEAEEEILHIDETAPIPAPVSKRSKVLLATAGLFLTGVIGTSFIMDNAKPDLPLTAAEAANENQITVEMLERWKGQYNEIRESSPKRLGLDETTYNQLEYVKKADQQMERLLSNQNAEKMKNEQKKMQRQVDELMLQIETPKEMVLLFNDAFLSSAETQKFLVNYALKSKELMLLSEEVLANNNEELAEVEVNGELSAEKLLAGRSDFSEEVQNLVDSLSERSLTVIKHPLEDRFITRRNTEALHSSNLLNNDYEASNYVGLLMNDPYFDEEGLLQPVSQMPYILTSFERPLLESVDSSPLYQDFAAVFQHTFFLTMKGGEGQTVFDRHGIVKGEYQEAWKQMAEQSGNPLIYVMLPIIEEMEASGWTGSKSYDELGYDSIIEALEMEKAGKLAAKLPNGDVAIEQQLIQLERHDFAATEKLYKDFSAQHDLALLKNVLPLDVLLLFDHANSIGDADTMWHLLSGQSKPPLAEYKRIWRQQPGFQEYIKWIEVNEGQITRIGPRLHLYLSISPKDETVYPQFTPSLVMQGDATWFVQYHLYENYDLSEKDSVYKKNVYALYNEFNESLDEKVLDEASPGEIAGMLLKAFEEENTTMLLLLFEGPEALEESYLLTQLSGRSVPHFSDVLSVAFYSDSFYYGNGNGNGGMEHGSFQFEGPNDGADMEFNQLTMVKTPSGWRFGDLNMY
ncbi:MAG TPA: hypothetical protein VLQ20_12730 [Planococcus sp. (in: firmicutes)]|nr:hypothetical protein [Planococcus sp. (in: firmicutes)]